MKKIINGKRYDTDTAKELGWTSSAVGRNDFHFWKEVLYQKRTGEFFLYGEGGPASRYSRAVGLNEWSGGERLMPLTLEEAMKWAEENLDGEEYESIFSLPEETEERKVAAFSLSENTISKIALLASSWKCSKSEVIDRLVSER